MLLAVAVLQSLVTFTEPGFPTKDLAGEPVPITALPGERVDCSSVADLEVALTNPNHIFVWRHGSTFPADAWQPMVRFLEEGGDLLVLGGAGFLHPVVGPPGGRVVQPRMVAMLKALQLNQSYRIDVGGGTLRLAEQDRRSFFVRQLPDGAGAWALEPKLTSTEDFPEEDGSPGSRDALCRRIGLIESADLGATELASGRRFPIASGAFAIEHLRGRFAGSRMTFRLVSAPPIGDELRALLPWITSEIVDLRADPTFGCFHPGEQPSLTVRGFRPEGEAAREIPFRLRVSGPTHSSERTFRLKLTRHGNLRIPVEIPAEPGLHRVTLLADGIPRCETGYWVMDEALFTSGGELSFDHYTLRRDGKPEPVMGTTLMSDTVHRDFLFEPNAAVWDDEFAELASLDFNMVRTGIWSAYKKIQLDPGVVDEAWLRALEAYYLTARKHGIPVLFTFFAFAPPGYGSDSPYFDPRAIEGQSAYLTAVAERFAGCKEILWDLINEPSFADPDQLWQCRPDDSAWERDAFRAWLKDRFGTGPDKAGWEHEVRSRWRLLPGADIGVPTDADFEDRQVMGGHHPYRAKDYIRFVQDAFVDWVEAMKAAIRAGGSKAAITVGQDEGGLHSRPRPLHHHHALDFTSMHTWWNNHDLLWDGVLAKGRGTPLLLSESGIMQRELLSGEALRSPEDTAALLSRKVGYAFAAGGFGVVQWCYDVNPYMASDNEVAIGFRRVDGSYKPEHAEFARFARFITRNRELFDGYVEPEVALVIPEADPFGARELQTMGTRNAVRELTSVLGRPPQAVSMSRLQSDLPRTRAIVLPSNRGVSDQAWHALRESVHGGAHLLCSGWFETDEVGRPAGRLERPRRPFGAREMGHLSRLLPIPQPVVESWYMPDGEQAMKQYRIGEGLIRHEARPLDWTPFGSKLWYQYQSFAKTALVATSQGRRDRLHVTRHPFQNFTLVIAVNESAGVGMFDEMPVPAGKTRMWFADAAGNILDRSHP